MSFPQTFSARGFTPREIASLLRVNPDRVRAWIKSGQLGAINTAPSRCGRPRYVVLPHHLTEFEQRHRAGPAPKTARRRRLRDMIDYYPD